MTTSNTPVVANFQAYKALINEYEDLIAKRNWLTRGRKRIPEELQRIFNFELPQRYLALLTFYTLAHCPICGAEIQEAVDTFSLAGLGWGREEPLGFGWFGRTRPDYHYNKFALAPDNWPIPSYTTSCPHIQGLSYGISLNGIYPNDVLMPLTVIGQEKPAILHAFIAHKDSLATLRTLPVGRLDDEEWQPRYTAWFMAYFNPEPQIYRACLPQVDMSRDSFYWTYSELDDDLAPLIKSGKVKIQNTDTILPTPPHALLGRWSIWYGHLKLIPEKLWGHLKDTRHPAYYGLSTLEQAQLAKRGLNAEGLVMARLVASFNKFLKQDRVWASHLPFQVSTYFMHTLYNGTTWTLCLKPDSESNASLLDLTLTFEISQNYLDKSASKIFFRGPSNTLLETISSVENDLHTFATPANILALCEGALIKPKGKS